MSRFQWGRVFKESNDRYKNDASASSKQDIEKKIETTGHRDSEMTCPFCYTTINEKAAVCRSCGAQKGIGTDNYGNVFGASRAIRRIVLLLLLLAVCNHLSKFPGGIMQYGAVLVAIIAAIGLINLLWKLIRGPRWFR